MIDTEIVAWGLFGAGAGLGVGLPAARLVADWPTVASPGPRGRVAARSRQHVAVASASSLLGAVALAWMGPTPSGLVAWAMLVALVPIVAIDLEHLLIPDLVVVPATVLVLAVAVAAGPGRWWVPLAASAAGGAFMGALSLVSPEGMGLGDAKLTLLLGAALGASVVAALAIAFALGALAGLVLLARDGVAARRRAIPFGPFLAAGALCALALDVDVVGRVLLGHS